jgi:membrane fusion protein (multidrug efflux system)
MIRTIVVFMVAAALGAVIMAGYERLPSRPSPPASESPVTPPPMPRSPVATVRVVPLQQETLTERLVVYGTVVPAPGAVRALTVPFESSVRRVFISQGEHVDKGSPLLELAASPDGELQLQEAEAAYAAARQVLHNSQRRVGLKLATEQELLQAKETLRQAELRVQSLKGRGLGRTQTLLAAKSSVVYQLAVQRGMLVPAGTPLVETLAPDRVEVVLGVEPEDMARVRVGQSVRLAPVTAPQTPELSGQVRAITAAVDPATRLFNVFVSLPVAVPLPLGIFVKGEIILASHDALVVPRAAVLPKDDHYVVFTVKDQRAQAHRVQVGIEDRAKVEVIGSDLAPNDLVIVLGNYELHDGMAVTMEETSK